CNTSSHKCSSNPNRQCLSNADCNVAGTCTPTSLECTGATTVWIKGKHGSCQASQVGTQGDCATGETCEDEGGGTFACASADPYPATVSSDGKSIDLCVTTRGDGCFTAAVAYCSIGNEAADNTPTGTGHRAASGIRFVNTCAVAGTCVPNGKSCFNEAACKPDSTCVGFVPPDVIEDWRRAVPPCSNEVGSFCCGLTQGAYGAPNSIATAQCSSGSPATCPSSPATAGSGCGFIPAACSQGCDVFAGDPNPTTAG